MEGYQVSNQCMALVRDGCLVPTKDAPELGYVIESTDKQYIPDVFYKVSSNILVFILSSITFFESLRFISLYMYIERVPLNFLCLS